MFIKSITSVLEFLSIDSYIYSTMGPRILFTLCSLEGVPGFGLIKALKTLVKTSIVPVNIILMIEVDELRRLSNVLKSTSLV